MPEAVRPVDVIRVHGSVRTPDADRAAVEEPLEIRLHGRSFAVVMRTPGDDRELAAGFLLSEDVVTGPDELGAMAYCQDADNVLNVTLAGDAVGRLEQLLASRRQVTTNSSCGVPVFLHPLGTHWTRPSPQRRRSRSAWVQRAFLPVRRVVAEAVDAPPRFLGPLLGPRLGAPS